MVKETSSAAPLEVLNENSVPPERSLETVTEERKRLAIPNLVRVGIASLAFVTTGTATSETAIAQSHGLPTYSEKTAERKIRDRIIKSKPVNQYIGTVISKDIDWGFDASDPNNHDVDVNETSTPIMARVKNKDGVATRYFKVNLEKSSLASVYVTMLSENTKPKQETKHAAAPKKHTSVLSIDHKKKNLFTNVSNKQPGKRKMVVGESYQVSLEKILRPIGQRIGLRKPFVESLEKANTLEDISSVAQMFLAQYNVNFNIAADKVGAPHENKQFQILNDQADAPFLREYVRTLIYEVSKYPLDFMDKIGVTDFDAVKNLQTGDKKSVNGLADITYKRLVFDINKNKLAYDYSRIINHEIGHPATFTLRTWSEAANVSWASLNMPNFEYSQLHNCDAKYTPCSNKLKYVLRDGFISSYAKTSIIEDEAETFSAALDTWRPEDDTLDLSGSVIASKVTAIKNMLRNSFPQMNADYFKRIRDPK